MNNHPREHAFSSKGAAKDFTDSMRELGYVVLDYYESNGKYIVQVFGKSKLTS